MKKRVLLKQLENMGCVFIRHGGKHDWYQNPKTKMAQPVPRHREINERLAKHIIKMLMDHYCILRDNYSGSKNRKLFYLRNIRIRKMQSFLEHNRTAIEISNYAEFLIPCDWMLSCNPNIDVIFFIDLPQGGEPMK